MKQDIKKKWVEALRSGKYAQGRKLLRWGDRYCCLGVLCDLHAQNPDIGESWGAVHTAGDGLYEYMNATVMPPDRVMRWAELSVAVADKLARLNDAGAKFEFIAAEIDEY